jgi:hypothetical protein
VPRGAVRKVSITDEAGAFRITFRVALPAGGCRELPRGRLDVTPSVTSRPTLNGDAMSVLMYIALTVAVFALLGLAQKLVERP